MQILRDAGDGAAVVRENAATVGGIVSGVAGRLAAVGAFDGRKHHPAVQALRRAVVGAVVVTAAGAGVAWAAKLPAQLLKVYAGAGQAEPPTSAAPSTPAPARGWQI